MTSISPSAINVYTRCQRLYAFTYVNGQWGNEPPGAPTTAGKKTHSLLENWFKNQVPIPDETFEAEAWTNDKGWWKFSDARPEGSGWRREPFVFEIGKLAQKLLLECPEPGYSEHKFTSVIEGIEFKGVVDLLTPNYIVDFKTTSSDLKWAKTGRKLLNDPQRLIYAAAFPEVGNSRWITGKWDLEILVGERRNEASDKEKFKLHVLQPAEGMLSLGKGIDPCSLPLPGKIDYKTGMTEECTAFGKVCAFAGTCFPKKSFKLTLPDIPESKPWYTFPVRLNLEDGSGAHPESTTTFSLTEKKSEPWSLSGVLRTVLEENKALLGTGSVAVDTVLKQKAEKMSEKKYLVQNLYIDCLPLSPYPEGEALEYSYEYIAAAGAEVAADMHIVSPMLADFGKGPHLVCAQLIAHLSDREEPIKHLFLETRSAEGRACMQELTSRSRFVVKGCY